MPPAADVPPRSTATPPGRRAVVSANRPGRVRRLLRPILVLVTLVLVADALVGENGWFEHRREQTRLDEIEIKRDDALRVNAALTERRDRLNRKDPALIEDLARRNLGMLKAGEYVFIDGTEGRPTAGAASTAARRH